MLRKSRAQQGPSLRLSRLRLKKNTRKQRMLSQHFSRGEDAGTYLGLLALKEAIEKMEVV